MLLDYVYEQVNSHSVCGDDNNIVTFLCGDAVQFSLPLGHENHTGAVVNNIAYYPFSEVLR
jgi:hypothetical protein